MPRQTADPSIFHITHVDNLPGILAAGCLYSDSGCRGGAARPTNIGYSHIKQRRLARRVTCAARGCLGDYVPFNFCSRSVMLYVISKGHTDYTGGQDSIVHLRSSVQTAVGLGQPWAFTDRHADVAHALYYDDLARLGEVDWSVMSLKFWNDPPETKEKRQAEFLVHQRFPWQGVLEIGCINQGIAKRVSSLLRGAGPSVSVRGDWYY
jgi:hypothetical protein